SYRKFQKPVCMTRADDLPPTPDINIDDCWSLPYRDGNGKLIPDPAKWPDGIKPVVDRIHELGLKFGLYGCAGEKTCAGYPGSDGDRYAASDVAQLVEWGVDFWYVILSPFHFFDSRLVMVSPL